MDSISLIVRGDDFGLCHAANQAICEGFEAGVLTCASLAVTGPWLAEAADLIHDHPEWEIGLQLMLHCDTAGCRWGPAAGATAVPSLVQATGLLAPRLPATATAEDIARELDAQVERARLWGIAPAFLEYAGEANPFVDTSLHHLSEQLGIPARMAEWGIQSIFNLHDTPPVDPLAGLAALPSGVHLWIVHPAQDAPETWALWPEEAGASQRHTDARAICNPEIIALIEKRGIELVSFRQHIEARVGGEAEKE